MSAGLKYGLGRVGLFVLCAVPIILVLPDTVDLLLKLLIALVLSAVLSFFLLRGLRDEVSNAMIANRQRKDEERAKLRSALSGDDDRAVDDDDHR